MSRKDTEQGRAQGSRLLDDTGNLERLRVFIYSSQKRASCSKGYRLCMHDFWGKRRVGEKSPESNSGA